MLHSISNIIHTLCKFPSLYVQSVKFHLTIAKHNHRISKYNKAAAKQGLPLLAKYNIK